MPAEDEAPYSGAALLRRTSVLGWRPKTLAQGEFTSPEHFKEKGGGGRWPPKPKKKDSLTAVLLFGTSQHYRCHSLRPFASVQYIILLSGRQFSAMSLQSFDAVILRQDFHLTDGDGVELCQPLGLRH